MMSFPPIAFSMTLLTLLSASIGIRSAVAQDKFPVEVAGLQVVHKVYPPEDPKERDASGAQSMSMSMDRITPFNAFHAGVSIAFFVRSEQGGILSIDEQASQLETFTDDKGKALAGQAMFGNAGFGAFAKASKDGKVGYITVEGPVPPSAGATKVTAKGTFAVRVGTKQTKHNLKQIFLKKGTKIKAGTIDLAIGEVSSDAGEVSVTFETNQPLRHLSSYSLS